jgi:hypothetical protein
MKIVYFISFTVLWLTGFSQPQTVMSVDSTRESKLYWAKWLNGLYDMGVDQKKDSIYIKEEVQRLVKDSAYRNSIYPQKYDWPAVVTLMKSMELKKSFWHLINIYADDTTTRSRSIVLGTLVLYDSLVEMDKLLINSYYTYAFTDPRVCHIKNGKPDIFRPDLLEKNLAITKEIINNIRFYRKGKNR